MLSAFRVGRILIYSVLFLGLGTSVFSCPEKLRALHFASNDYDRLFLRDVSKPPADPQYLINNRDALRYVFLPWFLNHANPRTYQEMLQQHHRMAALGSDGQSPYKTDLSSFYKSSADSKIAPGEFRPDFIGDSKLPLNEGLKILENLVTEISKIKDGKSPVYQTYFLRLLSDYIYVFLETRPFMFVNNSIVMSQVNAVLVMHGYQGIEHGYLDLRSKICKSPVEFFELFQRKVFLAEQGVQEDDTKFIATYFNSR